MCLFSMKVKNDTKRVFWQCGTCSRTFCYLLDREFGHVKGDEERAADPLAGGIMKQGHQCGMLWGAALAVGDECFQRYNNSGKALALTINTTQRLVQSFLKTANSVDCREITNTDFSKRWELIKYLIFKARGCFTLAERWAPEAIKSAKEEMAVEPEDLPEGCTSCASEVVKKMGGSNKEIVMVAGFAGGFGLSGNACGALAAAIWMNSLGWSREHPGKSTFSNPRAKDTLEAFYAHTGSKILCHEIAKERFDTIDDHTKFIRAGGCKQLIIALARS